MCAPRWSSATPRRRCCSTRARSWRAFSPWRSSTARSATSTRCAIPTSSRPSPPHAKSAVAEISAKLGACEPTGLAISAAPMRCCGPSATPRTGWSCRHPPPTPGGGWGPPAGTPPSLSVQPVDPADAFDVRPGSHSTTVGGGWIGYLSYPDPGADGRPGRIPEAAGGWTDCVLRCDRDRQWWFESLSGAPMPDWLAEALTTRAPTRTYRIDWDAADRQAHRAGVLACLEAIRAGEGYPACVSTQFAGTIAGEPLDFFIDGVARTAPARAAYVAGPWG